MYHQVLSYNLFACAPIKHFKKNITLINAPDCVFHLKELARVLIQLLHYLYKPRSL